MMTEIFVGNSRATAVYRLRKAAEQLAAAEFNLLAADDKSADLAGVMRLRCEQLADKVEA